MTPNDPATPRPQHPDTRAAAPVTTPAAGNRPEPRCAGHALAALPQPSAPGALATRYPADAYWPLPGA